VTATQCRLSRNEKDDPLDYYNVYLHYQARRIPKARFHEKMGKRLSTSSGEMIKGLLEMRTSSLK